MNAIETSLLDSGVHAVQALYNRLRSVWPDDYARPRSLVEEPGIFDLAEEVLQFEVACALRHHLGVARAQSTYVSWEESYSHRYAAGKVDLVIAAKADAPFDSRVAIETKWMAPGSKGVWGVAGDVLKLAWADAKATYVLIAGRHDKDQLVEDVWSCIDSLVRSNPKDWQGPDGPVAFRGEGIKLAGWRVADKNDGVAVALLKVRIQIAASR